MNIAFLGAGEMGGGMVRRLLAQGQRVIVWSRDPSRHLALATLGARLTDSIPDAVASTDVVIGCLRDTAVTRECYLGASGVLHSVRPGQIIIEHGTFDPSLAVEIARAASVRECDFLDAPVTGGPERARSGELVTMVGGAPAALERTRAVLGAYCSSIVHTGASGSGERLKLINQLLVSVHVAAAAEASALIIREGIDPNIAHRVLMGGWAASAMLDRTLPRAARGDFANSGATVGKLIEVQPLVAEMLRHAGVASPMFSAAQQQFDTTADAGGTDLDLAALVTAYNRARS